MSTIQIPISVLNLAPIRKGQGPKEAIDAMVDLAQATEKMGYTRYWIAEHHNTPTLVSSATSILIKHRKRILKKEFSSYFAWQFSTMVVIPSPPAIQRVTNP